LNLKQNLYPWRQTSYYNVNGMGKIITFLLILIFLSASCVIVAKPAFFSTDTAEKTWMPKAPINAARTGLEVAAVTGLLATQVTGTITVGEYPGGMAYDSGNHVLYVANGVVTMVSDSPPETTSSSSTPTPAPSPSEQPTETPESQPKPFTTTLIIATAVLVAIVCAGLLAYFRKRKR
jgi:hypothetical protein